MNQVLSVPERNTAPGMSRRRRFGALVAAMAAALVLAGCSSDHGAGHGGDGMPADAMSADAMFAQMMIPHHQQAVEMAALVEGRASSPFITQISRQISDAQQPEIALMTSWLEEWGVPVMSGMDAMSAHGGHGMAGMLTDEQLAALEAASGEEFDRLFAEGMIEHHRGAVAMAQDVLEQGSDPRVAELAREIIATQEAEILELQAFLAGDVPSAMTPLDPPLDHVHGAAVVEGRLLVATHDGLHEVDPASGATSRIGASGDDLMGFAVDADTLYASGHPGPGSDLPDPLGLLTSSDGGASWSSVSLLGEVDFHGLAGWEGNIAGIATDRGLLVSTDAGQTWAPGPLPSPWSIAWFAGDLWIASDLGLVRWSPTTQELVDVRQGPAAVALSAATDGSTLWAVDAAGEVWSSADGKAWAARGSASAVEAIAGGPDTAYLVTWWGIEEVGA